MKINKKNLSKNYNVLKNNKIKNPPKFFGPKKFPTKNIFFLNYLFENNNSYMKLTTPAKNNIEQMTNKKTNKINLPKIF